MNRERELVDEGKEKRKKKVHPVPFQPLGQLLIIRKLTFAGQEKGTGVTFLSFSNRSYLSLPFFTTSPTMNRSYGFHRFIGLVVR